MGSSVASVNPDGSTKQGALERLRAQGAAKAALAAIANTAGHRQLTTFPYILYPIRASISDSIVLLFIRD